jgi:sterol desaturase/sphingolipid hydroxylase (fatty acid hydroxylase superfamily)
MTSILKSLLRFGYAPFLLVAVNGTALALVASGAPVGLLLALLGATIAFSFASERLLPAVEDWNRDHGDSVRDWVHAFVNEAANASSLAMLPWLTGFAPGAVAWPGHWPFALQVLGAVLVLDAGITAAHFLSHRVLALWRFHAVHHSVRRMYGLNGLMKHPVHQAVEMTAGAAPLVLLGMPFEVATMAAFCTAVQLLLQHSNVDYRLGPFERWIAGNRVHRFHHVREEGAGDVNFGLFTTLGDRLLGTFVFDPTRTFRSGDVGLAGRDDYPVDWPAQMLEPWRPVGGSSSVRSAIGRADGTTPSRRRKVRVR